MPSQQQQKASFVLTVALGSLVFVVVLCSAFIQTQLASRMWSWSMRDWIPLLIPYVGMTANAQEIDLGWYPPSSTSINNLTAVLKSQGVYGFVFNTSETPDEQYGTYNWCNMPHVRKSEYVKPADEYELKYVEVVSRFPRQMIRDAV